jgi:hypothetical protein
MGTNTGKHATASIPSSGLADAARRLIEATERRDFEAEQAAMESLRAELTRIDSATGADADGEDLLSTLRITRNIGRRSWGGGRGGGRWVGGTIAGHGFEALVFPERAECESYELCQSRISKLWLRERRTHVTVANFDRGWDVQPTTPLAARLVDLVAAGLAETIFPEAGND